MKEQFMAEFNGEGNGLTPAPTGGPDKNVGKPAPKASGEQPLVTPAPTEESKGDGPNIFRPDSKSRSRTRQPETGGDSTQSTDNEQPRTEKMSREEILDQHPALKNMLTDAHFTPEECQELFDALDVLDDPSSSSEELIEVINKLQLPQESAERILRERGVDDEKINEAKEDLPTKEELVSDEMSSVMDPEHLKATLDAAEDLLSPKNSGEDIDQSELDAMEKAIQDAITDAGGSEEDNEHKLNDPSLPGHEFSPRRGRKIAGGILMLIIIAYIAALNKTAQAFANAGK